MENIKNNKIEKLNIKINKNIEKEIKKEKTITKKKNFIEKKQQKIKELEKKDTKNTKENEIERYYLNCDIEHLNEDIERLKEEINKINEIIDKDKQQLLKLEENNKMYKNIDLPALNDFLSNWKTKAIEFYLKESNEYEKHLNKENEELKNAKTLNERREVRSQYKNNNFSPISKLLVYKTLKEKIDKLNELLDEEIIRKKEKLLKQVILTCGKIQKVQYLEVAADGSLNGIIQGENQTVKVETIYAGGYNIQCLHYRVLVKPYKLK